jgi:two-component system OmpR family response regulator
MEKPEVLLEKTRKTWLSGMSPVAADVASADSAPGAAVDEDPVAVEVAEACGVVALDEVEEDFEEPQPAAASAASAAAAMTVVRIGAIPDRLPRRSDNLLNGLHPKLLIAEDDAPLRDVLVRTFRAEGFSPAAVGTARELLERAAREAPDALVIDVGLPDGDGRDLCQALRARGVQAPVLFLTARDSLTDRLSGFSAGGDDYVTKPFEIEEVLVRLRALLRRAAPEDSDPSVAGFEMDPTQLTVSSDGAAESLTPTEFRLLAALAARQGKAMTRRDLIRTAWPHGAIVQDNTLDVYIARLRRKLRQLPRASEITTVHGHGYRLK